MDLNVKINQVGLQMQLQINWITLAATLKAMIAVLATLATALATSGLLHLISGLGQ